MAQQTERLDKYLIGVLILTVLQFLDVAFTKIILASGYGEEINPITRQIMESTSMDIMFGVKLGTACFALSILLYHRHHRIARHGIEVLLLIYATLTTWHIYLLFQIWSLPNA